VDRCTSLRCAYAYRDIGGTRLYLRAYEGGLAPTLRMKPGETLKIRLINDLPPNRDILPSNPSHPHQFNNTNFHFHAAHCSPSGIADNVMRSMAPGKSYDVEIALPADHTRGTYWYHIIHGSADVQVASGMAGAIIVEGDFADVPEIARARERSSGEPEFMEDAFHCNWSPPTGRIMPIGARSHGIHPQIRHLGDCFLISFQKSGTSRRPNNDITPQDRVIDPLPSPAFHGDGSFVASAAERNQRTILRRSGRLPATEFRGCHNRCLYRQV
jgi:hypothetical protein